MEVHHLPQVQIQIQIQKLSGRWENHMRHHPPHLINAFFWDLWILKTPGRAKLEYGVAYDVHSGHLFCARHSMNIRAVYTTVISRIK